MKFLRNIKWPEVATNLSLILFCTGIGMVSENPAPGLITYGVLLFFYYV
jgi:hypothetical protein